MKMCGRYVAICVGLAGLALTVMQSWAVVHAEALTAFANETVLVMVDDKGCIYCVKWNKEVAPGYQASDEGQFAPLERRPKGHADLRGFSGIRYTPTFILVARGQEVGRIVGYGGEDHFWGELGQLMRRTGFRPGGHAPKLAPLQETRILRDPTARRLPYLPS
jgi:hypothetical protein